MSDVKVTTFFNETIKIHGKPVFSIRVNSDSRKVEIDILDRYFRYHLKSGQQ